jgi:hypothetical protein
MVNKRRFLAGTASGTTKCLVGHPFDTIKTRLQTNPAFSGPWECLSRTLKLEGVRGLYKVHNLTEERGLMTGIDASVGGMAVYGFGDVGIVTYLSTLDQECHS